MPPIRIKRRPYRTGPCLLLLAILAFGCGDFCVFCGDQGGGDGSGGTGRTAEPGDLILADQQASSLVVYEYPGTQPRTLLEGFGHVSGLALFHDGSGPDCDNPFGGLDGFSDGDLNLIDTFGQQADTDDRLSVAVVPKGMTFSYDGQHTSTEPGSIDLLFFTVNTEDTLYLYDLSEKLIPQAVDNPMPIRNQDLSPFFGGRDFFESPTALAVGQAPDKVAIFVINDNGSRSSVRRLSVDLSTWVPEEPQTIGEMTRTDARLVDLAYFEADDTLFVTEKITEGLGVGGRVYRISEATSRDTPVDLTGPDFFIQRPQSITGTDLAPTSQDGTAADLLLAKENIGTDQIEQYDTAVGSEFPEAAYTPATQFDFIEAVTYDCTNERLVMTNVPMNDDLDRTLLEAFPRQP